MAKNGIIMENVSFSYQKNLPQLKNINLKIKKGSFCGVTGVNGSGKTTLTLLLNGLIPHEINGDFRGDVFIDQVNTKNKPVSYFSKNVGMVFQNPDFMLFNLTVKEEIDFGLKNLNLDNREERISASLKMVDMTNYLNSDPQSLSYGQKQKICLACILAQNPSYIVLDEPTAMLDYKSALKLYGLLDVLNKQGKTIIIVEHDTDFLLKYCSRIIVLDQGKVALIGSTARVFSQTKKLEKIGIKIPQKHDKKNN